MFGIQTRVAKHGLRTLMALPEEGISVDNLLPKSTPSIAVGR